MSVVLREPLLAQSVSPASPTLSGLIGTCAVTSNKRRGF